MTSDTDFLSKATSTLTKIYDALEAYYEDAVIEELEFEGGILTLEDEDGRVLVMNIHEASQQLWLASPLSGGMHFDPAPDHPQGWVTAKGEALLDALNENLKPMFGIDVSL